MTMAAFFFHKGGQQQLMLHNQYTEVTWPATKYNIGGGLRQGNRWIAPYAGVLSLHATVWLTEHVRHDAFQNLVLKFRKNGSDVLAVPSTAAYGASVPLSGTNHACGIDVCKQGDAYDVISWSVSDTGANDVVADGNMAHTHWSGVLMTLPPDWESPLSPRPPLVEEPPQ